MEKLDLSTNSKKIQDLYNKVVRGDESTNYGVFSVDKSGTLDATASGPGGLDEFVEEFTDGQVQFGLVRVTVPGSDVFKNILLGWCPDNAPAKLRLSFAANFAEVSKVLSGYHVQITARDSDDLDVDELIARVGAAAGARYTFHASNNGAPKVAAKVVPTAKPFAKPSPAKPSSFVPKTTGKPVAPAGARPILPKPVVVNPVAKSEADDGWGGEKEIEERDFEKQPLEDVPSAYKKTTVNIEELRKQKSDTISSQPVVKPVVEPRTEEPKPEEPKPIGDRLKSYQNSDGRLSSLPKPKVSHAVSSRYAPSSASTNFGSKPSFGAKPVVPSSKKDLPEGVFQNHANVNGLTPAQAWALKKGKYKVDSSVEASSNEVAALSIEESEAADVDDDLEEPAEESSEIEAPSEKEVTPEPERFVPAIIKPATSSFPAPPKRNLPPAPENNESPQPSLPSRSAAPVPELPSRTSEPDTPKAVSSVDEGGVKSTTAVAQYDYEKDEDNEVEFKEGDIIVDIEFVDEEWWSGKNSRTNEVGVFPGSYVTIQKEDESGNDLGNTEPTSHAAEPTSQAAEPAAVAAEPQTAGAQAVAEFDYEKDEDNEIAFAEGDLIVEIEFVDDDWWSGKHSVSGEVGLFPANYVKLQ